MDKKKVFLIEPKKLKYLPTGLQKIATYHLDKGDSVSFISNNNNRYFREFKGRPFPVFCPDIIYISSLFTFYGKEVIRTIKNCQKFYPDSEIKVGGPFASLMPDIIKKETGILPHIGLYQEVENCVLNYSLFPKTKYHVIFTTRGCIRKCGFCAVKTLEPDFYIVKNWKEKILASLREGQEILIQDNNIIAAPFEHQKEVVAFLSKLKNTVDFNSGFDARIFKEKHAKLYGRMKNLKIARFAFDSMAEDGFIQRAIEMFKRESGRINKEAILVYTLYNYNETFDDFLYRLDEIWKLNCSVHPMEYTDLNSINRDYVGKNWTAERLASFKYLVERLTRGHRTLCSYHQEDIGNSAIEFADILDNAPKNLSESIQFIKEKKLKEGKIKTEKPSKNCKLSGFFNQQ